MNNDKLDTLLKFLEADPEDAFTLYSIAYEYNKRQEYEKAVTYFRQLRELHPDYVGLYYHLGKALEALQQTDEAEQAYRQGMSIARREGELHSLSELQSALNKVLGLDYEDEV
jgi:tetratricopeptide (TPR) repeat protein